MKKLFLILLIILLKVSVYAQDNKIPEFALDLTEDLLNQPVSVSLSGVDYYEDSTYIELYQVIGKRKIPVPSQIPVW